MPRYFILQGVTTTWAVLDTKRPEYPRHVCRGTKAEAEICAFALNAISEGKYIAASPGYTLVASNVLNSFEPGDFVEYDGPTEGVAP